MSLTGQENWATQFGRTTRGADNNFLLRDNETATGGLLASRIGGNADLMSKFNTGLANFNATSGVRPTTIASQNNVQREAIARIAGGSGDVEGKYFNPYTTGQRNAIDSASNAFSNITSPKINNFRSYDQNTYQQFMNPYIKDVINNNAAEARRREAERRNSINESFAEAGGFGSTALGLERSRNASESERNISEMDAQLRAQGFDMATGRNMQLYEGDRADDFSRQTFNANADLQAQLARAGGFLSTAGAYGSGLNSAIGLDQYGRAVGERNLDRMLFAGDRVQGQNQAELDAFYQADAARRQFPYTQNQFLADILARYPTGSTTTSTQPNVGMAQGALGGALVGSSLFGGSSSGGGGFDWHGVVPSKGMGPQLPWYNRIF